MKGWNVGRRVLRCCHLMFAIGHCAHLDQEMFRTEGNKHPYLESRLDWHSIGHVTRNPFWVPPRTDVLAIRLNADGLAPHKIYGHDGKRPPIVPPTVAGRGQRLCVSGAESNRVRCGNVVGIKHVYFEDLKEKQGVLIVDNLSTIDGDSGAPVWNARTGALVGSLSGGVEVSPVRCVQPLKDTPTGRQKTIRGALAAPEMYNLYVITGY